MEFSEVPRTTRLPFTYLQFDSSLAAAGLQGVQPFRCLLLGGGSDGSPKNKAIRIFSEADAKKSFGDGSMLHQMAGAYFKSASIEVWAANVSQTQDAPIPDEFIKTAKSMQFNVIACGLSGPQFLTSLTAELASRAVATRGLEGFALAAIAGDSVAAMAEENAFNSPFLSVVPTSAIDLTKSPLHMVTAALCGVVATSAQDDPALPFHTLELPGLAASTPDQWEGKEAREVALEGGVSTLSVDGNNRVRIERLITTYKRSDSGVPDSSYLSATTPFTLSFLRWDFARYFGLKYPRHKLASDQYKGRGPVLTPSTARAECVCLFRKWEDQGLVQDADAFINSLVCEISPSDPSRLNIILQPRLVSELNIIAAKLGFLF